MGSITVILTARATHTHIFAEQRVKSPLYCIGRAWILLAVPYDYGTARTVFFSNELWHKRQGVVLAPSETGKQISCELVDSTFT